MLHNYEIVCINVNILMTVLHKRIFALKTPLDAYALNLYLASLGTICIREIKISTIGFISVTHRE